MLFLGCLQSESMLVYVSGALQYCLCMLYSSQCHAHPPSTVIVTELHGQHLQSRRYSVVARSSVLSSF